MQAGKEAIFEKKLATYALAGAAVLAPGAAHASTITFVSGVNAVVTEPGSLTLTAGPTNILTISATDTGSNHEIDANAASGALIQVGGAPFTTPLSLAFGTLIDPAAGQWGTGGKMVQVPHGGGSQSGFWAADGGQGYLGFYFDAGEGPQAGWARLTTSADGSTSSFDVLDYAYWDQPNLAITAGQTTATPEPSTMALLALGGAGLIAYRRRRAKNA